MHSIGPDSGGWKATFRVGRKGQDANSVGRDLRRGSRGVHDLRNFRDGFVRGLKAPAPSAQTIEPEDGAQGLKPFFTLSVLRHPSTPLRAGFRLTTPKLRSVWGPVRSG